jgi:hypothetical protein
MSLKPFRIVSTEDWCIYEVDWSQPMSVQGNAIRNCSELSPGDRIEAWREDRVIHRGRVLTVIPEVGHYLTTISLGFLAKSRTGSSFRCKGCDGGSPSLRQSARCGELGKEGL